MNAALRAIEDVPPPAPSQLFDTHIPAPTVEQAALALIERFPTFSHLHEHRIGYWHENKVPKASGGCKTLATAQVVNDLYHAITGLDGIVVVNLLWWAGASERQRQAIVYHELSHLDTNPETGALRTRKHELEMFIGEARHFGDWRAEIADVAEQLALFRDSTAR